MDMRRLIEAIKNCIAQFSYRTGLLRLILHLRFRKHGVILMYHRVLPEREGIDSFSADAILVTPEEFDWQMQLLRRYMRPFSLESFSRYLLDRDTSMPPRACLVSFDDGWLDNLTYALPILEKHEVPAVIFVCTSYIGSGRCFWQEELARLIHQAWQRTELGELVFPLLGAQSLAHASAHDIRSRTRELIARLKARPIEEIQSVLDQVGEICRGFGIDPAARGHDLFLRWENVAALSNSKVVSIGSHAVSHVPLTQLTNAEVMQEMTESRQIIESRIGQRVDALAYPNGDFSSDVMACAREAGYRIAVSTLEGKVQQGDDPFNLKRINIHKTAARTPARFLCRLAGIL
jgi:peptidoglycan/xylan/chitin deacetylase (PgdA/CDA1 family)